MLNGDRFFQLPIIPPNGGRRRKEAMMNNTLKAAQSQNTQREVSYPEGKEHQRYLWPDMNHEEAKDL